MTTQVQIQGNVEATQEARTLVSRVLDINTTDNRLAVHNGSTLGGIPHVTYRDYQNNEFTYAIATGTNALTISLAKAPTGYIQGQEFIVKPATNNTGAVTLNVNSLGAKNVYKDDGDGTLVALEADDLKSGIPIKVIYDGTQFIVQFGGGSLNINSLTDTTITASDEIVFADATDSFKNKKDTVQGIINLIPTYTQPTAVGAVGTYSFLYTGIGGGNNPGDVSPGSNLAYSNTSKSAGSSPPGTWRAMGDPTTNEATLYVRIS